MGTTIVLSIISIFLAGVVLGIIAIVSVGIRREERGFTLPREDKPLNRARWTLREIIGNPKDTSVISRDAADELSVSHTDGIRGEGRAS